MAQAGGLAQVLTVAVERSETARKDSVPVIRWVVVVILAVIGSTLGGAAWIVQEVLAAHPVVAATSPIDFLFGEANREVWTSLVGPVMLMVVVWSLLILAATRTVRLWGASILGGAERMDPGPVEYVPLREIVDCPHSATLREPVAAGVLEGLRHYGVLLEESR